MTLSSVAKIVNGRGVNAPTQGVTTRCILQVALRRGSFSGREEEGRMEDDTIPPK